MHIILFYFKMHKQGYTALAVGGQGATKIISFFQTSAAPIDADSSEAVRQMFPIGATKGFKLKLKLKLPIEVYCFNKNCTQDSKKHHENALLDR